MEIHSMRFATAIVLFLMGTSSSLADKYPLGIRLVFDDGVLPEGKFCTNSEHELVAHHMYESVARLLDEQQRTGNRRKLVNCSKVCRGFPTGSCFVGYPNCTGFRVLTEEKEPISDRLESEHESISSTFLEMCLEEEHAVLESLRNGVEGVSDACNELLREEVDVQCFELDEDDDDDAKEAEEAEVRDDFLVAPAVSTWALTTVSFVVTSMILYTCWHRRRAQAAGLQCDTGELV